MPRNYIRKAPHRALISDEQINTAKKLIQEGKSQRRAAEEVGISEGALRKRLKTTHVPTSLGRFKPTFTKDQEAELAVHCQDMDDRFFGITINDLRRLAYEFATANRIEHRFDKSCKMAGRDWVEGFLKRNPILSLRQSAPISLARAIGFNKTQVERFYTTLKEVYANYNFRPNRIYNVDETGMSTVPKKTPKVVSVKGKKVVGKVVSAERGTTITAIMCMSATGHYVPPAFIYPRKRIRPELLDGGPTQSICMASDSGYVNTSLFVEWLHHFKDFVHPSKEDPVLLLLDNHSSHISLEGTNYAREHNIVMLTLPPHGSHKLQPLDVALHSPLKTKYAIECEKWMNQHPGRGITQFQVAKLFNSAFKHVANIGNAESGFRATGIFPFADDLFDETEFAPSSVTDQYLNAPSITINDAVISRDTDLLTNREVSSPVSPTILANIVGLTDEETQPAGCEDVIDRDADSDVTNLGSDMEDNIRNKENTSDSNEKLNPDKQIISSKGDLIPLNVISDDSVTDSNNKENVLVSAHSKEMYITEKPVDPLNVIEAIASTSRTVTVAQLSPLPKMTEKKKRTRVCLKSEIITSSPYKAQLEEKHKSDQEKRMKKSMKVSKRMFSELKPGPSRTTCKGKKKLVQQLKKNKNEESTYCSICSEKYEDPPTEDWIQCIICNNWFHENCTAYENGIFRCDFCTE